MTGRFIGPDGWRCGFEDSVVGIALTKAVQKIPGAHELETSAVQDLARMLYVTAELGPDESVPRNRPASTKKSKAELKKLIGLSEKLELHILSMHKPAISALQEFIQIDEIIRTLGKLYDKSVVAYSNLEKATAPGGAPSKSRASLITEAAADILKDIAGCGARYTTDPQTSKIRGEWPEFLAAVFDALSVSASVEAQVRALRENRRLKRANLLP